MDRIRRASSPSHDNCQMAQGEEVGSFFFGVTARLEWQSQPQLQQPWGQWFTRVASVKGSEARNISTRHYQGVGSFFQGS